jgi:hypothetical protein
MSSPQTGTSSLNLDHAKYDRHPCLHGLSETRKKELLDALFEIAVQFAINPRNKGSKGCG